MLNLSHNVNNAPGDKTHLGIMLSLGVYACYRGAEMPLVRTDARGTQSSRAPVDSHDIVITRAVCVPTVDYRCSCCKMSSGTSTDEIHTFSPRELCLCGVLSWCIRHSVRLSVCHKLVLGSVSKLLNVRSRKERCIVAQLRNLGFWCQRS